MSRIFDEDELAIIEGLMGTDYVHIYKKIWQEREHVKIYKRKVQENIRLTEGYSRLYWEYKLSELQTVLDNQGSWLFKVLGDLKDQIPDEMFQRLEEYLKEHEANEA